MQYPSTFPPLQAANSMKDQTLQAIDQSVVTAAKFLQDFASDEGKRDCLRAYVKSKKIVKWISEEIKGHFTHTVNGVPVCMFIYVYIVHLYIYKCLHKMWTCIHVLVD